jgi:hypothetical protein
MDHTNEVQTFLKEQEESLKASIDNRGGLPPTVTILFYNERDGYKQKILAIPEVVISSDTFKDMLTEVIIPSLIREERKRQTECIAVVYITEMWMRKWNPKDGPIPDNYRDILPKTEAAAMSVQTSDTQYMKTWIMERNGTKVTKDKGMIPDIHLKEYAIANNDGIFTGGRFYDLMGKSK